MSLAHHVIAMWFIRCRLPFRKDFVQYITKVRPCDHTGVHQFIKLKRDRLRRGIGSHVVRRACVPAGSALQCTAAVRRRSRAKPVPRTKHQPQRKAQKVKPDPLSRVAQTQPSRCLCGSVELGRLEVTPHKYVNVLVAATPFRLPWLPSVPLFCPFFSPICPRFVSLLMLMTQIHE